jgi:hypothetical protein
LIAAAGFSHIQCRATQYRKNWRKNSNSFELAIRESPRPALKADQSSPGERISLFLLSTETREKRRLTLPPQNAYGDTTPAFSPDGGSLACVRQLHRFDSIHHVVRTEIVFAVAKRHEARRPLSAFCRFSVTA